jgi:drug/metabolite transporter (DMT)-like permease
VPAAEPGGPGGSAYDHILRPTTPRRAPAVAAMFVSAVLFAGMSLCTKILGTPRVGVPLPAAEVTLFRFALGTAVMLPLLACPSACLLGHDKPGLVWRGITGGLAVYAYFLSIQSTSLTNAVLLNFSSVIFAPLFAAYVLRERITRRAALPIAAAVVGILLVTRPIVGAARLGDAYGLVSGVLAGSAITCIRRLRQQETASSVFFYFSAVGAPIATVGLIGHSWVWPTPLAWLLLLVMGFTSIGGQMLMTYGYKYVRASEGVLITLSQIVYSAVCGAVLFGEPIIAATLVGGALILGAALRAVTWAPEGRA